MGNSASTSVLRERFTHLEVPSDEAIAELLSLPTSLQDVYDAVKTEDIEEMIASGSGSIFAFLYKAVAILNEPFVAPEPASNSLSKLNCLRYLTRILPVLLQHSKEPEVQKAMWGPEPLAAEIADAVMKVAFLKGFTVVNSEGSGETGLIWYPGLIVPKGEISAYGVEENQAEVLRCILACCSDVIYEPLEDVHMYRSPWVQLFASKGLIHSQTLCYSLLNAVSGFKPETGLMPMLSFGVLSQEVAMISAQLLVIFLHTEGFSDDEDSKPLTEVTEGLRFLCEKNDTEAISDCDSNVYLTAVRNLSSDADLALLFQAVVRLLSHRRELGIEEEVLLLGWELCFHCPILTRYIAAQSEAKELCKHLIHLMWVCLDDQALAGPLQVSCFLLLLLSTQRAFSLQLGTAYQGDLGVAIPQGVDTLLDILIVVTHRLTQTKNNAGLVSVMCTIVGNVSNFVKRIGTLASVELVSMLKIYTQPKALNHDVAHLQIVRSLLDTITTRIQYYWEVRLFLRFFDMKIDGEGEGEEGGNVQVEQWYRRLPLDILKTVIRELDPKVENLAKKLGQVSDTDLLSLFSRTTLVGQLPIPQPVFLQPYHSNPVTFNWMLSYAWAVIYMKHQYLPMFDYPTIRLFGIRPPSS